MLTRRVTPAAPSPGSAMEAGFDGRLVKPVDPEKLAVLLSAATR
jgi:hypothetical protein